MSAATCRILFAFVVLSSIVCAEPPASNRRNPIWRDPNREAPMRSRYHVFESKAVGGQVSCLVWLPPAYQRNRDQRFPVIYWLHGASGNQRGCFDMFMPAYFKALRERDVPPAIVVAVNGIPGSFYLDASSGDSPVESMIVGDLIPDIDRNFRTIATREGRLIEGFSMGGFGAARLGLKYPELFGAVAINAGGPIPAPGEVTPVLARIIGERPEEMPVQLAKQNADKLRGQSQIRIVCGLNDDLLEGCRHLSKALSDASIPHRMVELPKLGHNANGLYSRLGNRGFSFHRRAFGDRDALDE